MANGKRVNNMLEYILEKQVKPGIKIYTTIEKFVKWSLFRDGGLQYEDGILFAESASNRRVSLRVLERGQVENYWRLREVLIKEPDVEAEAFVSSNFGAAHSTLSRIDQVEVGNAIKNAGLKIADSPIGGTCYELENPPYGMMDCVWIAMWKDAVVRVCTHMGIDNNQRVDVVLTGYEKSVEFLNSTLSALVIPD